jgi:hypothetical protein
MLTNLHYGNLSFFVNDHLGQTRRLRIAHHLPAWRHRSTANATGQIRLRGEFDPIAGTTSGDYLGTIWFGLANPTRAAMMPLSRTTSPGTSRMDRTASAIRSWAGWSDRVTIEANC